MIFRYQESSVPIISRALEPTRRLIVVFYTNESAPQVRYYRDSIAWFNPSFRVFLTRRQSSKKRNLRSTTPALLSFVKAPLEVVFRPPFFLLMGMNGRDPFIMNLRSSLDPVPNGTRVNLVFSTGCPRRSLLNDFVMITVFLSCFLPVFRS